MNPMKLIDGKEIAAQIKQELADKVTQWKADRKSVV